MRKQVLLLTFIALSTGMFATVRNVPATYTTIQSALTACLTNDTVRVQPGTYMENLIWPNIANIKLLAVGDSSNTTINGSHAGTVIVFNHPIIDTNTIVRGFKITNGYLNASTVHGGGIQITSCSPKFFAVSITANHIGTTNWGYGAGLYASGSSFVIVNSTIIGNVTDSCSWGYGGGVYITGVGSAKFRNVKIDGNIVNSDSWMHGAGVYVEVNNAVFTNCSASNNSTGPNAIWYYGCGMYFETCTVTLYDVKIVSNSFNNLGSYYYGAGLYFKDCTAKLINALVVKNTLGTGGNFYNGAGIYATYSAGPMNLKIINSTIADNNKSDNSSFSGSGLYSGTSTTDTIINSILYNPNPGLEMSTGGGYLIQYSDVRGGVTGTGNINILPAFVSATDYHLTLTSPCVDTGTVAGAPPFDLDGNPRPSPIGTNPDLGCYERGCTPPIVSMNLTASQDTVCTVSGIVLLAATPAGGTYSGTGVTGATFNPATAGVGSHTITYMYTDGTGCTGIDSATIVVENCTGVDELGIRSEELVVYPNPSAGQLRIADFGLRIEVIKITNALGQTVYQSEIRNSQSEISVDISSESKGIYFIIVQTEKGTLTKKIIKE